MDLTHPSPNVNLPIKYAFPIRLWYFQTLQHLVQLHKTLHINICCLLTLEHSPRMLALHNHFLSPTSVSNHLKPISSVMPLVQALHPHICLSLQQIKLKYMCASSYSTPVSLLPSPHILLFPWSRWNLKSKMLLKQDICCSVTVNSIYISYMWRMLAEYMKGWPSRLPLGNHVSCSTGSFENVQLKLGSQNDIAVNVFGLHFKGEVMAGNLRRSLYISWRC